MRKKIDVLILAIILLVIIFILILYNKRKWYSINATIGNYNIQNEIVEEEYLNFLKENIKPLKIRKFIENDFVPTSLLSKDNTGKDMIELMKFIGYEFLFDSLFDKERTNFNDCPVTDSFKNKFNINLFDYFKIKESEDCKVDCSIEYKEQNLIVEVYGNFENTEPTYWKTHHFHYTLDSDGNVDDVKLDNISE